MQQSVCCVMPSFFPYTEMFVLGSQNAEWACLLEICPANS